MKDSYKLIWAQVDKIIERDKVLERLYNKYKDEMMALKTQNTELLAFAQWE